KICRVSGAADFAKYSGDANACPTVAPQDTIGFRALVNDDDLQAGKNPGYPFFVPGLAGQRPPAPPLDFAPDKKTPGTFLDGGLPRHVMMHEMSAACQGAIANCLYEKHNTLDFSKFNDKLL